MISRATVTPVRAQLAAVGTLLVLQVCVPPAVKGEPMQALDPVQQVLVGDLSRRYRIAGVAAGQVVDTAFRAAKAVGLDPLVVLAVISIESGFNPLAESVAGAKGLMQIIPRFHRDKLAEHGGEHAVLDPESNIRVGARILQEYVQRAGSLLGGLQFYNGAARDSTARYAHKVLAEHKRLLKVSYSSKE